MTNKWLELNKASWNERAPIHVNSFMHGYDLEAFKAGRSTLVNGELDAIGDVTGKELVHLQCHFGLDTLSWARAGAKVTGLDFSEEAIAAAREIAAEIGVEAEFVVSNVYDAAKVLGRQYDIVYTGIGAICWLPDIDAWAQVMADLVKPRGEFYFVEFHPTEWIWDEDFKPGYDYFTPKEGLALHEAGSYADPNAVTEHNDTVQWNHTLGEVVSALIKAGLRITELKEHDTTMVKVWDFLEDAGNGLYKMPADRTNLPFMYTLRAVKG
jgi:SAM-dependent methyltransferase